MGSALRVLALILLGLGVIGFGLMSLCSGVFLVTSGFQGYGQIALVGLLVFGSLLALCVWGVRALLGAKRDEE